LSEDIFERLYCHRNAIDIAKQLHTNTQIISLNHAERWWHGVVGSAFRMKWTYSTPGPVSTAMGDWLPAGR